MVQEESTRGLCNRVMVKGDRGKAHRVRWHVRWERLICLEKKNTDTFLGSESHKQGLVQCVRNKQVQVKLKDKQILLLEHEKQTECPAGDQHWVWSWHKSLWTQLAQSCHTCVSHLGVWREHHGKYSSPRGSSERTSTVRSCWNSPCWDVTTFWCLLSAVLSQPWEPLIWFCWGNSFQKLSEGKSIFVSFWCLIENRPLVQGSWGSRVSQKTPNRRVDLWGFTASREK